MRASRPIIAWISILALVIAVIVIMQRRDGNTAAADPIESAQPAIDVAQTPAPEPFVLPDNRSSRAPWVAIARELARDSIDGNCVQLVMDAAAFAGRGVPGTAEDQAARELWFLAELGTLERNAATSRDPEQMLASLLLSPPAGRRTGDPAAQSALLEFGALAVRSGSPLLTWHALRLCADAGQSCPIVHLEKQLLDLQRDNAEAWALAATLRYARGDTAGALAAMQGAARATTSNWHWPETIALVERALAANTAMTFPDTVDAAFGVGATSSTLAGVNICRAESGSNRAWAEACLAFGNLRRRHNETEAGQGIAYSTIRPALTALGDVEQLADTEVAYQILRVERMADGIELLSAGSELQLALIESDAARFHAWLGATRRFGETSGRREFFRQEVPALMERAGLLGRQGARQCVSRLTLEPRAVGTTRQAIAEHRLQASDELHVSVRDRNQTISLTRAVGPDGRFTLPRGQAIDAAGMTTEHFSRELAMALSGGSQPPEAIVIPIVRRPREELRPE